MGGATATITLQQSISINVSMPHAALWVVQRNPTRRAEDLCNVSMPHAALWVVQPYGIENVSVRRECFNAARGFVGGAADYTGCIVWCAVWFQCRTRLCGWCSMIIGEVYLSATMFQCRTRLCGWCSNIPVRKVNYINCVSMPHAALWVVQQTRT